MKGTSAKSISQSTKKEIERRALNVARSVSTLIPDGKTEDFEKPDFKVHTSTGLVGIEVTELMPAARSDGFSSPLDEKSFHQKVMQLAETEYRRMHREVPISVSAGFCRIDDDVTNERSAVARSMARSLADFVVSHMHLARPVETFSWRRELPKGFAVVTIWTPRDRAWYSHESMSLTLDGIHQRLAERIREKNALVETYRTNVPGAPIHLLLYSCTEVPKGIPITHGMDDWGFQFDFERVFFLSTLDSAVVEIRRAGC